jgi:hypothetical protein
MVSVAHILRNIKYSIINNDYNECAKQLKDLYKLYPTYYDTEVNKIDMSGLSVPFLHMLLYGDVELHQVNETIKFNIRGRTGTYNVLCNNGQIDINSENIRGNRPLSLRDKVEVLYKGAWIKGTISKVNKFYIIVHNDKYEINSSGHKSRIQTTINEEYTFH